MGTQGVMMRGLDFTDETQLVKSGRLLAPSYSSLYVGGLTYFTKRNEEKAVAVGMLNSIMGVCIGLGPVLGGPLTGLRLSCGNADRRPPCPFRPTYNGKRMIVSLHLVWISLTIDAATARANRKRNIFNKRGGP